ncbi:MAG: TolC family protein [Verrucomicrobia bacterium]|nr:TolC family protein [Verrucomicrobiota bacterium]
MIRLAVVAAVAFGVMMPGPAAAQDAPATDQGRIVSYDEALALAIQNSFELKLADEDVRDAQRRRSRAKRQYHPRLRVQGTARGDLLASDEWTRDRNLGAGLVLDWAPYRNGELLREMASSRVGMTLSALERRQAAIDIEHEFRRLYHELLNMSDDVELKQRKRDIEEQRLREVEADFDNGRATKSDVLRQSGVFFEADAAWRKSRQALQVRFIELAERTGFDAVAGVQDIGRSVDPVAEITLEDCIATAQGTRIALLTSRERVRLADLGVRYAKLKRLPSVYFFTGSDYALTQPVGGHDIELLMGVTVSYPLYGAGDTAAVIADAKAAAVRTRIQDSQTHIKVERDIREAYWNYVNTVLLLESTREREQIFEDDYTQAVVEHERGALSDIDFAAAEIRHLESRQRLRTMELDAILARAALLRAVGVGTLDEIVHAPIDGGGTAAVRATTPGAPVKRSPQ